MEQFLGSTPLPGAFCEYIEEALRAAREDAFNRICKKDCCKKIAINIMCGSQTNGGTAMAANECKICKGGYARYELDCNKNDPISATTRTHGPEYDIDDPTRNW